LAARQRILSDWRLSLAFATATWGTLLTTFVEGLSAHRALNRVGLLTAWILASVVLFFVTSRLCRQRQALHVTLFATRAREAIRAVRSLSFFARSCWLGVLLIAGFLFFVAVLTPSTNWDSMTYHLPRVMHWIQQQSVEHFPTENSRQIEFGPWAAFVQTHLFLLEGSDRLMNVPQWFAMLLTVLLLPLLVELLARFSGLAWGSEETSAARVRRQNAGALAALIGVTIPMGMMQSLTPQNDYITAFWIVCLHIFVLALFLEAANRWYVFGAAMAFGLGLLTKSTAGIYCAPLIIFAAGWLIIQRKEPIWKIRVAATFTMVVLLLNVLHGIRNFTLFGSPMGSRHIERLVRNERITPGTIASNFIRNLALHNNCGVASITRALNRSIVALHSLTGEKIDDPRTTYPPGGMKLLDRYVVADDYASSPVHVLAFVLAMALALKAPRRNARILGYAGLIFASTVLFSTLLKYQHWNSRFHLTYFVLLAPFISLSFIGMKRLWAASLISIALFGYALVGLRMNTSRPIFDPRFSTLPRESQYLDIYSREWTAPLQCISDEIMAANCQRVGLKLGFEAFEYPIWAMLRNRGFKGRIDHYYVQHVSARLATETAAPCAIITIESEPPAVVTNKYPYRVIHSPWMILWSDTPPPSCAGANPVK
jgi:hypothetical protein